jgi:hypothetical protein
MHLRKSHTNKKNLLSSTPTAFHFNQELRLNPSTGFMLSLSFSLRQKRVNFINENDSWLPTACNTKQRPDEFLTFTDL